MSEKTKKAKMSKKKKTIIGIGVGLLTAILLLASFFMYISYNTTEETEMGRRDKGYSKLIIALMPKTIQAEDNGKKVDFYIEYNKNFDPEKMEPIAAYQVYYYNDAGKKVLLKAGSYKTSTADHQVLLGFFTMAMKRANIMKNVIYVIVAILGVATLAYLIYLWYLSFVYREEKKKNKNKKKSYLTDFADDEDDKE